MVVLDGVDRLDDVDGAPDLRWLPDDIPPNVRIYVLTASGARPVATLRTSRVGDHGAPAARRTNDATSPSASSPATRRVSTRAPAILAAAAPTGQPRFLRVVLDELRQHGDHFTLGERITELCAATTIDDLYEIVLSRYERDFERDRPGLTRAALTALWAARRGLSESELLAIVGSGDDDPLPQALWSPLHLAAEDGLVVRGGLLGIAHADLRKAIEDRYLASEADRREAHAVLARYFGQRPLSGPGCR